VISTNQFKFGPTTDPAEFVALAERATNSYDKELALDLYGKDATVEVIADGAREEVSGIAAVEEALARFTGPLQASGYTVEKKLLCAGEGIIVNEWRGRFHGIERSAGVEVWRFNGEGKVQHHRLLAFFDVRSSTSPIAGIRLALGRPSLALRLLRARLGGVPKA
jgi:hypothetical protein